MTTLKAKKSRGRRRSTKKRVRRTKGKKNRRRRRTYKGGGLCVTKICKKWKKHMKHQYKMDHHVDVANNNCNLIPAGNYYTWINKTFNKEGEDSSNISKPNVRVWGDAMKAAATKECEANATNEKVGANPVNDGEMVNKNVGEPVFNDKGDLISGIAPAAIPANYVKVGGRKSRRRRRKKSKKSKKPKKRRRHKR